MEDQKLEHKRCWSSTDFCTVTQTRWKKTIPYCLCVITKFEILVLVTTLFPNYGSLLVTYSFDSETFWTFKHICLFARLWKDTTLALFPTFKMLSWPKLSNIQHRTNQFELLWLTECIQCIAINSLCLSIL